MRPKRRSISPWTTQSDAESAAFSVRSLTSSAVAPRMGGSTIKKLNRAASSRSTPSSNAAEMVAPLRLMPGSTATACATPITKACIQPIGMPSRPRRCAHQSNAGRQHQRRTHGAFKCPSNLASMASLNIKPTTPTGTMETNMRPANFRAACPLPAAKQAGERPQRCPFETRPWC